MSAHKTKKIHDNEQVIMLQVPVKCNKSTNVARVYQNLVRQLNADWECIVMDDTPKFQNVTKSYKEKQDGEETPS